MNNCVNSLFLKPVDSSEIFYLINSLKKKCKCPGYNGISTHILKKCCEPKFPI